MRTALLLICLISTLELGFARNAHHSEASEGEWNSAETNLNNEESPQTPVRLPRKFFTKGGSIQRLNIENQTGFDGKVERISFDSDEEKPGIRAYGQPRRNLEDNGFIERVALPEVRYNSNERSGRLVEAYGMPKQHLENNGHIERVVPAAISRTTGPKDTNGRRLPRSIDGNTVNEIDEKSASETEDLEAQDAKVFRPLFVYRQQAAERQRRNRARNQAHGHYYPAVYEPSHNHRHVY